MSTHNIFRLETRRSRVQPPAEVGNILANFIYIFACLHVTNNDIFYEKVTKKKKKKKIQLFAFFIHAHFIKFNSNWTSITVLFFL